MPLPAQFNANYGFQPQMLPWHGDCVPAVQERHFRSARTVLPQVVHDRGSAEYRPLSDLLSTVVRPVHGREQPQKRSVRSAKQQVQRSHCTLYSKREDATTTTIAHLT